MSNQAEEVTIIRTLNCELCERFDSILLTQDEIEYRCNLNTLNIGSHSINHLDHTRIVYFDQNGSYLGDTISLNVSDFQTQAINPDYPVFKKQKDSTLKRLQKTMLQRLVSHSYNLCIVGPSYAGKTSLALYLESSIPERYSKRIQHAPTMGKSVKRMRFGHSKLVVVDMGGQHDFWDQWNQQLQQADRVIFVVDGAANSTVETITSLKLVFNQLPSQTPLLILLNKIDLVYDGYTKDFIDAAKLLEEVGNRDNTWVSTTSIYNGVAYDYTDTQEESSLAKVIVDFLDR